ncbi:MAG: iron-sulfur cluster assembly accessory protein [Verrucomicrobiae bacterium]|nr:iron-sulfur cluster assembly accessory protein [Verrucomicrobiae bacterium]MDW8311032.1 iron-sulfur cluster assembly accessory protein [Verrucomicrobiales bacterium]
MIARTVSQTAASAPASGVRVGDERVLRLTPRAGAKVAALLAQQGRPHGVLRVSVIGGGCSGLQYQVELEDGPKDRDILVETAGVRVVVDSKSAIYVSGSEVDYIEALQNSGFKIRNPNAASTCSCGESFSV